MNNYNVTPPIGVLPEYMRHLVFAIAKEVNVDVGLALATLISGMASAVHGLKVARRPDGGTEPLSLFSCVLAGPTTGKTRTHKLVHRAHSAQDIRRFQAYERALRRRPGGDSGAAEREEPADRPRLRWVSVQDCTNRALLEALKGVGEACSMSSHEGQNLLSSDIFRRKLETLNLLFDGEKSMLNRVKSHVMAIDASVIVLTMVQRDIFDNYCDTYGKNARGIGFFARTLFTSVPSAPLFVDSSVQVPTGCLYQYDHQVTAYLDAQCEKLESGITAREEMEFSPEACQLYWEIVQDLKQLARTTYWHMQDATNRALQVVIRVAAIMHAFSGDTGNIPSPTLEAAYAIVQWHLAQFAEIFPPEPFVPAPPQQLSPQERTWQRQSQRIAEDRQSILNIITELCMQNRESSALKSEVMTLFRERAYDARFRAALLRLVKAGEVLETGDGKDARLSIVPQRSLPFAVPTWCSSSL
jgi:hypothetical protein